MNENELGHCRIAFEQIYRGVIGDREGETYKYHDAKHLFLEWRRAWEACREHYLTKLDQAKLAQYELHENLFQEAQRIIALKNENDRCRRALQAWYCAEYEGWPYSKAQELRDAALAAREHQETPEMKGPDLTGIERECCGTFHGTPHRSTCKNFNTKTRKRDPFYDDSGSGHDLAI